MASLKTMTVEQFDDIHEGLIRDGVYQHTYKQALGLASDTPGYHFLQNAKKPMIFAKNMTVSRVLQVSGACAILHTSNAKPHTPLPAFRHHLQLECLAQRYGDLSYLPVGSRREDVHDGLRQPGAVRADRHNSARSLPDVGFPDPGEPGGNLNADLRMPRFFDSLFVSSRLRCLPDEILFHVWMRLMCLRFLSGVRARRCAAIVIQRAWDVHVHGSVPDLLHYDPHDMPFVVPYNSWMWHVDDLKYLEEVD